MSFKASLTLAIFSSFLYLNITMLWLYQFALMIGLSCGFNLPPPLRDPPLDEINNKIDDISKEQENLIHHGHRRQRKSFTSEIGKNEDLADFYPEPHQPRSSRFSTLGGFFDRHRLQNFDFDEDAEVSNVTTNWITQPLDNFDENDKRIWKQRYFSNSEFHKPDGPVFLYIGGESEEEGWALRSSRVPLFQWAKENGAHMFAIEHRYYGYSRPTPNQSVENLKYLSSEQALADIANFIEAMNEDLNLTNPKWITFGGSYAGALSAWSREIFPELTVGAVASSAPIKAKVDFFEYFEVVQKVLFDYDMECGMNTAKAFAEVQSNLWSIEGRDKLNALFNLSKPFSGPNPNLKDIQTFLHSLMGPFGGDVQYSKKMIFSYDNFDEGINERFNEGAGVADICEAMTVNDTQSPLENLQNIFGGHTVNSDYKQDVDELLNEDFNSNYRTWKWQTCTEFGFYQTTDMGRNIFGDSIPINYYIDLCTDAFDLDRISIDKAVEMTQKMYGGTSHYEASRVVFPNGSVDPWHASSLYTNNHDPNGIISILIQGTSHCADMLEPNQNDPPQLTQAREKIRKLIQFWLA